MTLGLGIFLAALIMGSVLLYSVTKDRWRWGTWFKRIFLAITTLVVVGIGAYFGLNYYNNRPQPFTAFDGVTLGDSEDDVKFKKGAPPVMCTESGDPDWVLWGYDKTAITFKKGYGLWSSYTTDIEQGKDGLPLRYPDLGDVTQFDSLEWINKRYGPPSAIKPTDDGLRRTYSYRKYNLRVQFAQDKVKWYGIYNVQQPDIAPFPKDSKRECHYANDKKEEPPK